MHQSRHRLVGTSSNIFLRPCDGERSKDRWKASLVCSGSCPRMRKRTRPSGGGRVLLRSEYPHHVWAIDFQYDQMMDGRTLKLQSVLAVNSRVCLVIRVAQRCRTINVIDTIRDLLKLYLAPTHLCMDNGPESIAHSYRSGVRAASQARSSSSQDYPRRIHAWNPSIAVSGMSF